MKKCPYCGGEYRDELEVCPIDKTTLVDTRVDTTPEARRKLPLSLSLLSYLLLIYAACWLYPAIAIFDYVPRFVFFHVADKPTTILFLGEISTLIFGGVFFLSLFVALRRGSRFAYFVAFLDLVYVYATAIYESLWPVLKHYGDNDPYFWWAIVGQFLGFTVVLLPVYVLLRRDVRQFFFNSKGSNAMRCSEPPPRWAGGRFR
jgi:hypothetical protein